MNAGGDLPHAAIRSHEHNVGRSVIAAREVDSGAVSRPHQRTRVAIERCCPECEHNDSVVCDAVEAEPNNTAGYVNRGVVYTTQAKYDKAIQDLDKAISLKSDSIPAYRFRAFAYLQMKDYKKAVEDYNVVLKEKDDPAILDRRAFAYWNLKEYDKAIEDFSKIIKDKPKSKEGYLDRSYVYELQGDHDKGIADCNTVLSLDPKNEDATNRKALLEYQKKQASATPTPVPTVRPRRTLAPEPTPRRPKG